jgi:enoyl-CoA hydratase/carnithine racemase
MTDLAASPRSFVEVEERGPAAVVTLNRPEQRNALSQELMRALTGELRRLAEQPSVRGIVVTSAGTVFSSGHNLKELVGRTVEEEREIFDVCAELMQTVQQIPQPVIAAVTGHATAAGCQLVATCDLAVAADDVTFSTPGVKIGLFCSTPMVALSRNIGRKRALEMLLTGVAISAQTAADWGLVNNVVPRDDVLDEALALVGSVANASPLTVKIGKEAFYRQIEAQQADAYTQMGETMATNAMTCDAQEGMSAFLEKRQPNWRGE